MEELLEMGFARELASQALAATGGKSTLKATEWLLNCKKESSLLPLPSSSVSSPTPQPPSAFNADSISQTNLPAPAPAPSSAPAPAPAQARVDSFFARPAERGVGPRRPSPEKRPAVPEENLKECPPAVVNNKKKNSSAGAGGPHVPLAERMRPLSLDQVVGQDHILGPGGILRTLVESNGSVLPPSLILWGPPGVGKTSLAKAIARAPSCPLRFISISAVTSGLKEVREVLEDAKRAKKIGQRTLLFVDEVHRFNKAQQDAFLPAVETGQVIFIGATTENPSFEVNAALLSRCRVITLNKLQPKDIRRLLDRALTDRERGVLASLSVVDISLSSAVQIRCEEQALDFLTNAADGDARVSLNALDTAAAAAVYREKRQRQCANEPQPASAAAASSPVDPSMKLAALKGNLPQSEEHYARPFKRFVGGKEITTAGEEDRGGSAMNNHPPLDFVADSLESSSGIVWIRLDDIKEALQRSHVLYDKAGEEHYNIISALHKSMRGGDPDASVYWLARMLEGGEGPLYVARRLIRFASEDVGLADPQALLQAVACYQACHFLGMPECNVNLAQCVAYLCLAPKSVAVYRAVEAAQKAVRESDSNEPVPLHLRNAPTTLMKQLGYGKGYIYPPNQEGRVEQDYLPPSLKGRKFLSFP